MIWLVFVVCLSISLVCFVCAVMFLFCRGVFGVNVLFVVWCVAVCCFIGFVVRVCFADGVVLFAFLFFCYGLNAFPVYECMLYVPYWRCAFLFV